MRDIFDVLYANAEQKAAEKPVEEKKEDVDVKKMREKFYELYFYQVRLRDGLLGEFSADGNYSIKDPKILEALLSLPKHLDTKENGVVFASTKIGTHVLNFEIALDIVETYCTATIYIVEKENRAEEVIAHRQEIGKLVEMYHPMFEQNALLEWNVLKESVQIGTDNFFFQLFDKYERDEKMYRELFDIWAQIYLLKYLDMLDGFGEKGFEVKAGYRSIFEKLLQAYPGIATDYTRLKLILDGLMLKYPGLLDSILASSPEVIRSYIESLNRARGIDVVPRVVPRETLGKPVEQKKKEEVKQKKKAAKKKEEKKKDKKKDDKKKKEEKKKEEVGIGELFKGFQPKEKSEPKTNEQKIEKEESTQQIKRHTPTKRSEPEVKVNEDEELDEEYVKLLRETTTNLDHLEEVETQEMGENVLNEVDSTAEKLNNQEYTERVERSVEEYDENEYDERLKTTRETIEMEVAK